MSWKVHGPLHYAPKSILQPYFKLLWLHQKPAVQTAVEGAFCWYGAMTVLEQGYCDHHQRYQLWAERATLALRTCWTGSEDTGKSDWAWKEEGLGPFPGEQLPCPMGTLEESLMKAGELHISHFSHLSGPFWISSPDPHLRKEEWSVGCEEHRCSVCLSWRKGVSATALLPCVSSSLTSSVQVLGLSLFG